MTRITRILRILGVPLFVVVRLIVGLSESRIFRIFRIGKYLPIVPYLHACLNAGRIWSSTPQIADYADYTDGADWKSVTSGYSLRRQFFTATPTEELTLRRCPLVT